MVCLEVKAGKSFTVRDAGELVELCHKYGCEIFLRKPAVKVNAKSLMGVVSVELKKGESVTVETDGEAEEEALGKVAEFIVG